MNTTLIITWTSVQRATTDMTVNIPSAMDILKSLWADQAQTPVLHCVLTARTNKQQTSQWSQIRKQCCLI